MMVLLLGACASHPPRPTADGPPEHVPAGLASLPDAVPRVEPINPYANRPYTVLGRRYVPDTGDEPFEQRGMASWYGREYHGNRTASGEPYDMFAMSAAHPTLPIPSYARVTSTRDGRSVVVRINDRGPFILDRVIDLSYGAAVRLGIANPGSGEVVVHKITAPEIAAWPASGSAPAQARAVPAQAAQTAVVEAQAVAPAPVPEMSPAGAPAAPLLAMSPTAPEPARAPDAMPARTPAAPPAVGASMASSAGTPAPAESAAASAPAVVAATPAFGDRPADGDAGPAPAPRSDAAPAAAPPASTPAAPAATGRPAAAERDPAWSVQFGAFSVAEHASRLREELTQRLAAIGADGLPAEAREVRVERTGTLSRVLIGRLFDRGRAQALAAQLGRLLGRETTLYSR